ncbi:MAG: co-chaperone GroES family protein [Candidatus Omnitrophica bacterium]|nr:co-chaperone GroES family protein [Candidatus Omnitrophota bacterium]MBU4478647.1 co-chaperone GroES family protein [Candidatus Omnitrophota bacterium]
MGRELIIIGDRVLIKPDNQKEMTSSGLYLPQGTYEKEKVHSGRIIKVGPGIPVSEPADLRDEPWKEASPAEARYVPLQAKVNDRVIFLRNSAVEIEYEDTKYVIAPQAAILALIRYDNPDDII